MAAQTEKTQTTVAVEGHRVVIQHTRPVGTQWLTPEQARLLAGALIAAAGIAEAVAN